jgi:hypothetical protein
METSSPSPIAAVTYVIRRVPDFCLRNLAEASRIMNEVEKWGVSVYGLLPSVRLGPPKQQHY